MSLQLGITPCSLPMKQRPTQPMLELPRRSRSTSPSSPMHSSKSAQLKRPMLPKASRRRQPRIFSPKSSRLLRPQQSSKEPFLSPPLSWNEQQLGTEEGIRTPRSSDQTAKGHLAGKNDRSSELPVKSVRPPGSAGSRLRSWPKSSITTSVPLGAEHWGDLLTGKPSTRLALGKQVLETCASSQFRHFGVKTSFARILCTENLGHTSERVTGQ
jgi:hypothetical protein